MFWSRMVVLFTYLLWHLLALVQIRETVGLSSVPRQEKLLAADPFDISTGIYYRKYTDLIVLDTIPIKFVRTQRNMDPTSRAFGMGSSTSYDMFIIGDTEQFSWVALVLADGSRVSYKRTSRGSGFSDGIFEDVSDPSEFLGSRIFWNGHGGWTVKMADGREYTVQGCNASSKPGQCAVTEIKNAQGDRLVIQRDRDGNILRITSPNSHFIDIKNDSVGHILRAQDDSGHWVSYGYDDKGCLSKVANWRGDQQEFQYDGKFNLIHVHEWGTNDRDSGGAYNFTVTNRFDAQNRFASQLLSTGDTYSAAYHADGLGHIRQTDVKDNTGLERYFFDEAGYNYKRELEVKNQTEWAVEVTRDPATRKIVGVALSCRAEKRPMPLQFAQEVEEMGEAHRAFISDICRRALSLQNSKSKH